MAKFIRIPLQKLARFNCEVFRIEFDLDVRSDVRPKTSKYQRLPFRLDTASDFTTIPIALAEELNIPFVKTKPVYPNTSAGKAEHPSYLSPLSFSFPAIPEIRFRCMCLFTPYSMKQSLFSLGDLVPNFLIRSRKGIPSNPDGFVILQVRQDHQGQLRQ
jgi:hypothetical protein